jgi:hypothetical protein
VDLAIANAGVAVRGDQSHLYYDLDSLNRVIEINLIGVVNTLAPLLKRAVESRVPIHLAAVSSSACFRGLPNGSYSASKAGVKTLMDTWRIVFAPKGIRFTTICPGFVESEITAREPFSTPFMISAAKSAALVRRALLRGKKTYIYPSIFRIIMFFVKRVPDAFIRIGVGSKMDRGQA